MSWADLFERAEAYETNVETIREALANRRESASGSEESESDSEDDDARE